MSSQQHLKWIGPAGWLVVKGIALTATGLLVGYGMTFVCLVRNYFQKADVEVALGGDVPEAEYAAFFVAMIIWLVIAGRFAWHNRTGLGVALSVIASGVFLYMAWKTLAFAYPVCNAF